MYRFVVVVVPCRVDVAVGAGLMLQSLGVLMVVVCSVPMSGGPGVLPVRPRLHVAPVFVWVVVLRLCCAVTMSVVFVSACILRLLREWW